MLIIKRLTKQCSLCPSASIMILQKGIAISLEGRHLVLTLFWLVAPHVSSRYKKSHSFQSLPLFWILYNDFLKFLGNRDKEFKLGPRYMNFRLTGNYITSCTIVI